MSTKKPIIAQDPAKPIERTVLAASIIEMSRTVKRIEASGLNLEAIVILVHHKSGLGIGGVRAVLSALGDLEEEFTTPKI